MQSFKTHLEESERLMRDLLELANRVLVCYCKPSGECHADANIEAIK